MKIGILREGKIPSDRRVPLLPEQCAQVLKQYPGVEIYAQPSDIRSFSNKEYTDAGITLKEDLSDCDILLGIKEVPVHMLIPDKTYLFFSHTLKKQPHNKQLMQALLEKNIRMIDYEALKNTEGQRIIAFGYFAGIVGVYNAFLLYGKKYKMYELKPAYQCFDLAEVKAEMKKIKLPALKIAVTGTGRVSVGAVEMLKHAGIQEVSPEDYLKNEYRYPVYTVLASKDYHAHRDGTPWVSSKDFHEHPGAYISTFTRFASQTDILMACAYWDPGAPLLFTFDELKQPDFRIGLIADITCDINGSIPSTVKPTNLYDPAYDFNPYTRELEAPFSDLRNITVMAVDNLPTELPRDASRFFGEQLIHNVLPALLGPDPDKIVEKGTITERGTLGKNFQYLSDYAFN